MSEIPTKWAIVEFDWGEGRKHIYSLDRWEIGYYDSEEKAFNTARAMIQEGDAKKMAILEVRALLIPKAVNFTELRERSAEASHPLAEGEASAVVTDR